MKIFFKILTALIIMFSIFFIMIPETSNATTTINSITDQFGAEDKGKVNYDSLKSVIAKLLGFLQVATGLISIVLIAFIGYSYIVATPPNLKGEMKSKMLPIVLGLMLVFSAVSIAKFIIGSME